MPIKRTQSPTTPIECVTLPLDTLDAISTKSRQLYALLVVMTSSATHENDQHHQELAAELIALMDGSL